ncbi:MAG: hypothetical protein JW883_09315 [Deltaproteobacteria bacterium]|nr:hypothetical protein [Deltaproteobacteria bacterium]
MFRITHRDIVFISILLVAMFCFPSSSRSQEVEAWSNLGLYGGQMYDIAIDPTNPDKMFAGSYMGDGLFVTEDGGSSWQAVETENELEGEDAFDNHAVWAVKIAPSNSNVIWAAHNYWVEKSTDGGQTWTHIRNSTMQRDCPNCGGEGDNFRFCRSIAIHSTNPDIVYVGTGGRYGAAPQGTIYKTTNGGDTWTKTGFDASNDFDHSVVDIDIDPQNSNVIWAVTNSFGYGGWAGTLYRSVDGGVTWEVALDLGLFGGSYLSVAAKPGDPNTAFTGSGYGIIKHWFDVEWHFSQPCPQSAVVEDISFDPLNSNIVYAVWLYPTSWGGDGIGKVARSLDGGDTWLDQDIYPHDYEFLSIVVHPANSEVIFGSDRYLGVYRSQNHGETWTSINNGINAVIVYDVAIDPNDSTHILAGTVSGLHEKRGGEDWLRLLSYSTYSLQFHPTDRQTFYAGLDGWLAKTTDGGLTWSYTDYLGLGVNDIAIDPTNTDTIFIACHAGGGQGEIQRSIDGGDTFEKVLGGVNQSGEVYDFNVVTIDPSDPQHIFAGGGRFYSPMVLGDLWESTDGGDTWDRTSLQNVIVNALLVDPKNPNIMYAGCGYSGGTEVPLYKSTNSGATWSESYEGIPSFAIGLRGVWGCAPTDVFAVGLFAYSDFTRIFHYDGDSWSEMDSGTTENLYDVWGSSAADVFAVGTSGTILHYDGDGWSAPMTSNTTENLNGVWGSSGTNVFAVGDNGTILRYDGEWSPMVSGTTEALESVWGSSPTDLFTVGGNGTILHYDGNAWSAPMISDTSEYLEGIWGASGTDVFAVGDNGTILHYYGNSWSSMSSGTTKYLNGLWGSSSTDVFAVGFSGRVFRYDGSAWAETDLGTTERYQAVWGTSGTDVFVVGDLGGIVHYDGATWTTMKPGGKNYNAVTDLEFHRENTNIVYASTFNAGVYVSPNQSGNWLNLGTPEHDVFAISNGSLYAATEGGLLQCTGTGVIAGQVANAISRIGIHMANVSTNDFGASTISIGGQYMMVSPSGICDVTATAYRYIDSTVPDVTVYGGDVSWADISMPPDSCVIETTPYQDAGIDDNTFIANDTSFAVHIEDPDGINIIDPASIRLSVNDGTTEYTRDLSHPSVTYRKIVSTEGDTQVTKIRVLYDRSRDDEVGDYAFSSTVNVTVDVKDVTQETCSFRVASEDEHNNVQIPAVASVGPELGVFDEETGQDAGIQVTSGPLKGAMLIYSSDELVEPSFGPIDVLPTLSGGVGAPMNLEPTNWSFDVPVKIYIPCPGYVDVSDLCVYFHNGTSWVYACHASGIVQPGGENWMVPGSRKNHNGGEPSTIEIQVYHFSGVQASASAPPSAPLTGQSAGTGGGGGGCFISRAACGSHMVNFVETPYAFMGLFILMGGLWFVCKFKLS